MSSAPPFFAADPARWERTLARLPRPLTDDEAFLDLRYLENEAKRWHATDGKTGRPFPGSRKLAERWGEDDGADGLTRWHDHRVRDLLRAGGWQDPTHPAAPEVLRPPRARAAQSPRGTGAVAAQSTAPDERTNAENAPEPGEDSRGRGAVDARSPLHARSLQPAQPAQPEQPGEDTPPPLDGEEVGHGVAGAMSPPVELAVLGKVWPAGAQLAWEAFLRWHPAAGKPGRGGRAPIDADRRRLRSAVAELGGAAVVDLVVWAHVSPDERSRWLRGRAPRSTSAFLGLSSLLDPAKRGDRIEWVARWVAEGRPHVPAELQGAPKAGASTGGGAHGLGGYGRDPWATTIVPGAVEQLLLGPEADEAARMVREGLYDHGQAQEARAELRRCLETVIAGDRDEQLQRVGLTLPEIEAKRGELRDLLDRLDARVPRLALA